MRKLKKGEGRKKKQREVLQLNLKDLASTSILCVPLFVALNKN